MQRTFICATAISNTARHSSRRGSALVSAMAVMLMVVSLGSALMSMALTATRRGHRDLLRVRALGVAEAGVDKAIYYLRGTAPDGTHNGSWRTGSWEEWVAGDGEFTLQVADGAGENAGRIMLTSSGIADDGARVATRAVRVALQLDRENVSIWNNVIFAGVGQSGQSLNGNVVARGSVHILGEGEPFTDLDGDQHWDSGEPFTDTNGNGVYDLGEPYTDEDGDGHRDPQEPFNDINGNGVREPPLTVTDLASELSGSANIGNNYTGMSNGLRSLLPPLDSAPFMGESVESLDAKLRAKHGRVNVSGSASVGQPNVPGGSPLVKETVNGVYVTDGFGGNQGAGQVYSDNGTNQAYNLGDAVKFPVVSDPAIVGGVSYPSYMDYLSDVGMHVTGPLDLEVGSTFGPISDGNGNSLYVDDDDVIHIEGIVYVEGDINLNRDGGDRRFYYEGRGTLVSTGSMFVHTDLLPTSTFPINNALGLIARRRIEVAAGGGDSQLTIAAAIYAQEKIINKKQNEFAGTIVSSYFEMQNVPHLYQVPELANYLPPGMPGADAIWVKTVDIISWREIAPSSP